LTSALTDFLAVPATGANRAHLSNIISIRHRIFGLDKIGGNDLTNVVHACTIEPREWQARMTWKYHSAVSTVLYSGSSPVSGKRLWGRKVSELGFAEFVAILQQVAAKTSVEIVQIDRWEPTSQACTLCDAKQSMLLSVRHFHCTKMRMFCFS